MIREHQIRKSIVLRELESVRVPITDLSFLDEDTLMKVRDSLKDLVNFAPDFGDVFHFRAGTSVGVIETNGLRVEVRPRLSVNEFMTFIRFAIGGKVPPKAHQAKADLVKDAGFEDVLGMLLVHEIQEILKKGISRKYEERREPLEVLRGRPLWQQNFPWRGAEAKEIVCRHSRITYDNLDNQIVLAGLRIALQLVRHKTVRKEVVQLFRVFQQLASDVAIDTYHYESAVSGYNRLNEHYETGHHLTKMLMVGLRTGSFFHEGQKRAFGLSLYMPSLFERFAERLMETAFHSSGYQLMSQTQDKGAMLDAELKPYSSVRPDYQVWKDSKLLAVVDAKYKDYWPMHKSGQRPNRKISNEDLYQLFFYQQRLQRKYKLEEKPKAIIISQLPEEDERDGRLELSEVYRRVFWQAGGDRAGDVSLFLIPVTRFLRFLNDGASVVDAVEEMGMGAFVEILKRQVA